jgi:hypothetical protein
MKISLINGWTNSDYQWLVIDIKFLDVTILKIQYTNYEDICCPNEIEITLFNFILIIEGDYNEN